MDVDVGAWYRRVSNHDGDPNKTNDSQPSSNSTRKSSLEQRHETQTFKPQPSPRMVKSWRQPTSSSSSSTQEPVESSFSRLKFYTKPSPTSPREENPSTSPRYSDNPRLAELNSRFSRDPDQPALPSPRFDPRTGGSYLPARVIDDSPPSSSSRLTNGTGPSSLSSAGPSSLSRNNFTSSYHGSTASAYLSRPSYVSSRSHETENSSYSGLKSPTTSRYAQGSYSETSSPRDYSASSTPTHRKYSFDTLEPGADRSYHYTPKGTRKYEGKVEYEKTSPRKYDSSQLESPQPRPERRHPTMPEPSLPPRGREATRDASARASSSTSFMPSSWKFGSWTLSSPLNLRKFRTASSDRATSNFERSRRLQPGYRSLNERDKQFYSSSGKSDNL